MAKTMPVPTAKNWTCNVCGGHPRIMSLMWSDYGRDAWVEGTCHGQSFELRLTAEDLQNYGIATAALNPPAAR